MRLVIIVSIICWPRRWLLLLVALLINTSNVYYFVSIVILNHCFVLSIFPLFYHFGFKMAEENEKIGKRIMAHDMGLSFGQDVRYASSLDQLKVCLFDTPSFIILYLHIKWNGLLWTLYDVRFALMNDDTYRKMILWTLLVLPSGATIFTTAPLLVRMLLAVMPLVALTFVVRLLLSALMMW